MIAPKLIISTSIPELLRMVPGVQVARMSQNIWAVSVRGFNSRFSQKLLVLQDGRTLYTPIYSGVFWDIQDTPLEDIERIEIIRGPGATLWGANAVNGVINIITKNARDTQGGLASYSYSSEDDQIAVARFGGQVNDDLALHTINVLIGEALMQNDLNFARWIAGGQGLNTRVAKQVDALILAQSTAFDTAGRGGTD